MRGYLARLKAKIGQKPMTYELPKLPKGGFGSFGSDRSRHVCRNDARPEKPIDSFGSGQGRSFSENGGVSAGLPELQERIGMAAGSVPERYLDTWARLQCQRPWGVTEARWRQAIDDAGKFLDRLGQLASEFLWTPGDLFDVPRDGVQGGLAWFLEGEAVRSLGPEHPVTRSGRVFDRLENNQRKSNAPSARTCPPRRRIEARFE